LQLGTCFGTRREERGQGGGGGGGQLHQPNSDLDMNDLEEQAFLVQLDASEDFLNKKFEDMLVCTKYTSVVMVVGFVQRHMFYRSLLSCLNIRKISLHSNRIIFTYNEK
jgi:hypothetical protein